MKQTKNNNSSKINFTKNLVFVLIAMFAVLAFSSSANAVLVLDDISFDPAIIASGDEVDIVVQFRDKSFTNEDKIGNPDYKFKVSIDADDDVTRDYILLQDASGDNLYGSIYSGGVFNKKFRIKVFNNAPAGTYEFKLNGQWYYNDEPVESINYVRFNMDVKREGLIIDISNIKTEPSEVRAGDNYIKLITFVENSGEKDAKRVEIELDTIEGMIPSYSDNNRVWVGKLNSGERKEVEFYLDIDENVSAGIHNLNYNVEFMDLDDNYHQVSRVVPFRIKSRPYLEVVDYYGEGLAGKTGKLTVVIKNTGEESAESVDVRILKEASQPFEFDVRSSYLGELEPNEEAKVIFDIKANSDANINTHDFKILIRSKGDSDEGDDNVYLYNRRAKYDITGKAPNNYLYAGIALFIIVMIFMIINMAKKKRNKSNRIKGVIRK